ncbi:prepilin-type N-terminal cleavage/methylation domain-containing protein, partial [uncultured Flavobacterium sp.]
MIKKVKSFTLSELIVVMIITVIVVGIAFSVLLLVKKQIKGIEKNYQKTTQLALFEEKFWRDFN